MRKISASSSSLLVIFIFALVALPNVYNYAYAETFLSSFGSSGSGNGQFNDPFGIAIDSSGNIYVVDLINNRVEKFNSADVFQSQFGSLGSGNGQFNQPGGIAINSSGNIYVTDQNNNRVLEFSASTISVPEFPFGIPVAIAAMSVLYFVMRHRFSGMP